MKRPPVHPAEPADPCCLPALGEVSEIPPHGGLAQSLGDPPGAPIRDPDGADFTGRRAPGRVSGGGFA